jgi:hypothetical protein
MPRYQPIKSTAASLLLGSILSLTGCVVSTVRLADRETVSREMPLALEYDKKRNELKKALGFLFLHGVLDSDSDRQIKESMSIEYVYYEASLVSLAHGNLDDYRNFIALAEQELARVMTVLTARVQALQSQHSS